ncbi:RNA polymerase subunit sigma-70 [Bradyrhizobium sp. 83012]|uniref:RNA polymerase subunit sigma-70 n=1 Tax=Bradyrhizobium aeschynomenes TaxID=2734909 RepID=A0ABX2CPD6_9BRAD|nr:RNA polymerase sigma factor region1.1 domain-containing protein [Bradyrhizobium aeschynomenes]NPU70013.1 RNA polymerase subunit sigma-70 [Bradyrhizobium aeschynomenes]NPV25818.1 RNA polymerase subunit sigma-70 [Bradyrhizobium aeschynomenes]
MTVSDIIRRLIATSEPDGEITFDELNALCGLDMPPEDIEDIFEALRDAGIQLVEQRG